MKANLLALGIGAAMLVACGLPDREYFGTIPKDLDEQHLRWCNSGEPEYVDPAMVTSTTGSPLARLMFSGLADMGTDFSSSPVPSIAHSWEVSDDQRTFTFHLRDDVYWSNGRRLTSADFMYHVTRILHPKTTSRNTTPLEPIKNAKQFNAGVVKLLTADAPPFSRGDVVEIVGVEGAEPGKGGEAPPIPNSNLRKSTKDLKLRDEGAPESEAYATVPAGEEVDIVEIRGPRRDWAYVYWRQGWEWIYGWVPLEDLDIQPHGEVVYEIQEIPPERQPRVTLPHDESFEPRTGTAQGSQLIMVPEVLGIRAPNDETFVIETWGPMPYMIDNANGRTFRPTPRESVSRSPNHWTRPENGLLVTSGPFTMTQWLERDRMEFVKSQTYFDKENVKLDRFTSYNMNDQAASANYYLQGGCDAVTSNNIPYAYLPALNGDKRGGKAYKDFTTKPYAGIYYYVINNEKVDNVHFRRALNMGIDRRPIPNLLHGGELPSASFVPGRPLSSLTDEQREICGVTPEQEGVATFVNPQLCYVAAPGHDFDLEAAKKELDRAREEMGDDFLQSFTLKFNTGVEGHKIIAEYVQNQWKVNLGLDVSLESMEWKTYLKATHSGEFEVARMGWIGAADPESQFLLVFKCGSPYNRARYCSDEYDRLFRKAEMEIDRAERLRIFRKAEEVMIADAPIIPIYVYTQKHLRKPYVKGMSFSYSDEPPMHKAWIDPDWRTSQKSEAAQ